MDQTTVVGLCKQVVQNLQNASILIGAIAAEVTGVPYKIAPGSAAVVPSGDQHHPAFEIMPIELLRQLGFPVIEVDPDEEIIEVGEDDLPIVSKRKKGGGK